MNKSIVCVKFKDIENAYVVISCYKPDETINCVATNMSFFYDGGEIGAEWEPDHGPINKIVKRKKEDEDARPHWFYEYYAGPGYWSQNAVYTERLPQACLKGNYDYIFNVLRKWAN